MASHEQPGEWESEGYDGRIRHALAIVDKVPDARLDIRQYRHVVVDEVQDLVGDRADFVDAILRALAADAGFTLLGDPAQGIYEFQLKGSHSRTTGRQFLRRILERAPEPGVCILRKNFRVRSKAADVAARSGDAIRTRALNEESDEGETAGSGRSFSGCTPTMSR